MPPPCPPSCGQNRPIPWALYRHLPNSLGGNLQIRSPRQAPGALGAGHDLPGREEPGSQDAPAPWVGADRHQARAALGRRGERTASRWCRPCLLFHLKVRAFVCIKCSNFLNWVFTLNLAEGAPLFQAAVPRPDFLLCLNWLGPSPNTRGQIFSCV